jgi:hypothetical protein
MMEKLAQPGEGGECTPAPFTISTITYNVMVYAKVERVDTLPPFLLYPYMYSVFRVHPSAIPAILHKLWGEGGGRE